MPNNPNPIVGHKTFTDGSHAPIHQDEAEEILRRCDEQKAGRASAMPDEQSAINIMHEAWTRLTELGWREATYCPKDGSSFDVIEPGSVGIFRCHYSGEWPDGRWWLEEGGDLSPSRPILFRLDPTKEAERQKLMAEARERYMAARKASTNAQ